MYFLKIVINEKTGFIFNISTSTVITFDNKGILESIGNEVERLTRRKRPCSTKPCLLS